MKKILYYNWVQFDNDLYHGGGVSVYQKNIIEQLCKDPEYQIFFLSSGKAFHPHRFGAYIEKTDNIFGERCKSFQIVNSPVLSSARLSFYDTETYLKDEILLKLFIDFFEKQGGFDVVHFNNFEGLTLQVLRVKDYFKTVKFIFSIHNYYLFCPEVQLWNHNKQNCKDFCEGVSCVGCIPRDVVKWKVKRKHFINNQLKIEKSNWKRSYYKRYGIALDKFEKFYLRFIQGGLSDTKRIRYTHHFKSFREQNILYFNQYIDNFLAVSQAVKRISVKMGLKEDKISTEYIGTKFAGLNIGHNKSVREDEPFTIIYMGYMNVYKGFYFLIDAMKQMNDVMASKIRVIICAKFTDYDAIEQLELLGHKFQSVILQDGYIHDDLEMLLKEADLGIVPVLWEDNLPQVAIEMAAYGVPVLASNLGGACELSKDRKFQFEAGNIKDFLEKLNVFVCSRQSLNQYWNTFIGLVSMEEHMRRLVYYYEKK